MKVHTLDIDSGDRDPTLYPNTNDYVIDLTNPVYNVSKISLISARIPNSQLLIHERNNTFTINSTTVSLENKNYTASELATEINTRSADVTSSVYDAKTNTIELTFSGSSTVKFYDGIHGYTSSNAYTTPHDILGMPPLNATTDGSNKITTGPLNIDGPNGLVIKLSNGSDEFNKSVYTETPFYTGTILNTGDTIINQYGSDDIMEHNFVAGKQPTITALRVQFFYKSNGRLIPYDFRNANHVLKFAITCSTDKLEGVPRVEKDFSLPPPVYIPEFEDVHRWDAFVSIFFIVATGVVLLLMMRKPPKLSE